MKDSFNLVEYFWTFQGEGANAGRRALFIRLPFCNLKCSWCDTEFNRFDVIPYHVLENYALSEPTRFAVLTGGEPSMNKQLPKLISVLKNIGFEIAIESNGTFAMPPGIDFITISPKRDAATPYGVHADTLSRAHEIKLVVDEGFDFEVAKRFEKIAPAGTRLSLSPEFSRMKQSFQLIEQFIRSYPRWRLSLQTHKWIGVR